MNSNPERETSETGQDEITMEFIEVEEPLYDKIPPKKNYKRISHIKFVSVPYQILAARRG